MNTLILYVIVISTRGRRGGLMVIALYLASFTIEYSGRIEGLQFKTFNFTFL